MKPDCDNKSQWVPNILVPAPADHSSQKVTRIVIKDEAYCNRHKNEMRINDFFGTEGWVMIKKIMEARGRHPPPEEDLTLDWVPEIGIKMPTFFDRYDTVEES